MKHAFRTTDEVGWLNVPRHHSLQLEVQQILVLLGVEALLRSIIIRLDESGLVLHGAEDMVVVLLAHLDCTACFLPEKRQMKNAETCRRDAKRTGRNMTGCLYPFLRCCTLKSGVVKSQIWRENLNAYWHWKIPACSFSPIENGCKSRHEVRLAHHIILTHQL
jgi:hypothetical protein